ncbi:hypothetical protein [Marinovum sp.]|uniref:hypothetical protein n=1 Tax=Marinovum sp. TaxID=2024839 RepID=UPI003A90E3E1
MYETSITDPVGQAIAAAQQYYVPEMCCSVEQISRLLFGLVQAGSFLLEDSEDGVPEAFLEAYLKHATAFEGITQHPSFAPFKAAVEGAWFGASVPNPFVTRLSRQQVGVTVAELLLDWRRIEGASYNQMVERLAIQKVALAAAAADPGAEARFIADDYETTEFEFQWHLEHGVVESLESRFFLGKDRMVPTR